jgi:hypothetical protein
MGGRGEEVVSMMYSRAVKEEVGSAYDGWEVVVGGYDIEAFQDG